MARILLADDEPLFAMTTAQFLEEHGHQVLCREDGERANEDVTQGQMDLVIADLDMPGNRELELLNHCRIHHQHIPVIVVTGRPSLPSAIESIRLGIHDYFLKPLDLDDLLHSIDRAIPTNPLASEQPHPFDELLGSSHVMSEVKHLAERIALSQATVLIRGESGTGKELLARAIHLRSRRNGGPFITVDCTAIPEALMESVLFGHIKGAFTGADRNREGMIAMAHQGTLFLDEIGELPLHLQSKLLRVLQFGTFLPIGAEREQKSDIRIVAATHRDLRQEVQQGNFRMDLFYRLSVLELISPPLRERREDIPELVQHFLNQIATRDRQPVRSITPQALELLASHSWPGNIRELQNAIERCVCLAHTSPISAAALLASLPDLDRKFAIPKLPQEQLANPPIPKISTDHESFGTESGSAPNARQTNRSDLAAKRHSVEPRSAERLYADDHSVDDHSADDHSADNHSADDHSADDHSADDHSADDHSADDHSADDHSADDHSADDHSADDHSADDHSANDHSANTHSVDTHSANTHSIDTHSIDTHSIDTHSIDTHSANTHSADTHSVEPQSVKSQFAETQSAVANSKAVSGTLSLQGFRESQEREYFTRLLERHAGNIAKAAREAELSRQGLHKALTRLGLSADRFRTAE